MTDISTDDLKQYLGHAIAEETARRYLAEAPEAGQTPDETPES